LKKHDKIGNLCQLMFKKTKIVLHYEVYIFLAIYKISIVNFVNLPSFLF